MALSIPKGVTESQRRDSFPALARSKAAATQLPNEVLCVRSRAPRMRRDYTRTLEDEVSGGRADARFLATQECGGHNLKELHYDTSFYARTSRSRRSLRSPNKPLGPTNEALHFRCTKWGLHHRPSEDRSTFRRKH